MTGNLSGLWDNNRNTNFISASFLYDKKNEKLYDIEIIKQTSFSTYFRDVKCFQISNIKVLCIYM